MPRLWAMPLICPTEASAARASWRVPPYPQRLATAWVAVGELFAI